MQANDCFRCDRCEEKNNVRAASGVIILWIFMHIICSEDPLSVGSQDFPLVSFLAEMCDEKTKQVEGREN